MRKIYKTEIPLRSAVIQPSFEEGKNKMQHSWLAKRVLGRVRAFRKEKFSRPPEKLRTKPRRIPNYSGR
jgi:hypothetical protein